MTPPTKCYLKKTQPKKRHCVFLVSACLLAAPATDAMFYIIAMSSPLLLLLLLKCWYLVVVEVAVLLVFLTAPLRIFVHARLQVSSLSLPLAKLVAVYEQLVLELLEMREIDVAR